MQSLVEGVLDLMRGWTPFGQGLFLLIVLTGLATAACAIVAAPFKYLAVILRGWPPESEDKDTGV